MKKKKHSHYGFLFYFVRFFVRLHMGKYIVESTDHFIQPAIYVTRHQNLYGPIHVMSWAPIPMRPWVLHVFTERKTCEKQFREYTFSKRFGWPKAVASTLAFIVSGPIAACLRSTGSIPVWREQKKILKTFELSEKALLQGESVIVFPDILYDSESFSSGNMYTGYFHLVQRIKKKTGQIIPIVPVYCTHTTHRLVLGKPIFFRSDISFHQDMSRVNAEMCEEIDRLAREYEI